MKKIILFIFLISIVAGASAQRKVRKEVRKGNDAYKEQLYGKAEQHYKEALEGNSASKEASFNLGNTYYRQGEYDKSLDEYRHYLTIENEDPANASATWSNIGNTLLKKKAGEKAAQQPQAGAAQGGAPQQSQVDYLKETMEAYKNALRINPNDNETRYNLAVVQKMIDDQEDEGGGGDDDKKDDQQQQDKKQDDQQQNKPKDDPKQDQKQDQQQQQQQNQMSKENMEQILKAIEQDEKQTQERVQTQKAMEQRQKSDQNRQQDKDW